MRDHQSGHHPIQLVSAGLPQPLTTVSDNSDTSDTIEENILKLQEAKKDLADQIVSKGGISFGELTKDDILKMIEESRP